ncbi:MAG: hypothetical protein VXW22_17465 [Pseudomonadota bacterium]|nr:hypothetical protein [Pseudomonadota bacterium]
MFSASASAVGFASWTSEIGGSGFDGGSGGEGEGGGDGVGADRARVTGALVWDSAVVLASLLAHAPPPTAMANGTLKTSSGVRGHAIERSALSTPGANFGPGRSPGICSA